MALGSALQIGRSGLFAAQTAIEVAGNNLANVATRGYHRQEAVVAPASPEQIAQGTFIGRGVDLTSVVRHVNTALESRLRGSIADQSAAATRAELLTQIETIQNELSGSDLSSELNAFFNAIGELANQPLDNSLRSLMTNQGEVLTQFIRNLRDGLTDIRGQLDLQLGSAVTKADDLLDQIEQVNKTIIESELGQGGANSLRDERNILVEELSKLMDVSIVEQPAGGVDLFVGSTPILLNSKSRGLELINQTINGQVIQQVATKADQTTLSINDGEIGALFGLRETEMQGAIDALDNFASNLIFEFNKAYSQGQGNQGFSVLSSVDQVLDPTLALTDPDAGLSFVPQHGSFRLHLTQLSTGQRVTSTINIDLDGINAATDTTLNSLAADINAVANISATVTPAGRIQITADSGDFEFSFSDDTSNVLASLGLNTFFTGENAFDIDVNPTLDDPDLLAVGRNHIPGDNGNSLALVELRNQPLETLGGLSISEVWSRNVEELAITVDQANGQVDTATLVRETLESQRQSFSGVNADEEAIDLLTFQRTFQASARFLTVVDELLEQVLALA